MKQIRRSIAASLVALALATIIMGCATNLPNESAGEYVDDAVITTKVKASILDRPTLSVFAIHVETLMGVVQLRGVVSSQAAIDEAVSVARGVAGVKSVKNNMQVM